MSPSSQLTIKAKSTSRFKGVAGFGFNTCHAPIVMRSDVQDQMRRGRQELGMRYWRCHGTLGDDVGLLDPLSARREPTFSGLKRIIDAGLASGVRPFFELSFMPSALARSTAKTITHYRGVISPPKVWGEWERLIRQLIAFLLQTYGAHEVRQWYFEVWNEPNIPFWSGTRAEYFTLYRLAARALKKADAKLRVGGPATARAAWVPEMLAFCGKTRTPIDFISTHIYPSDVAFVDSAVGDVKLLGVDFLHSHFRRVRREVDAARPGLPIIWGEWNSSAGPLAENHDECNNAALICAALAGMETWGDGSLFWNLSDIYEECQYHFMPFHGGYGLYTVDGIPKSGARAFEFWNALRGERMEVEGAPEGAVRGAFAVRDPETATLRVILWNHQEGKAGRSRAPWKVTLRTEEGGAERGRLDSLLPCHGSAYEAWTAMKRPANLSRTQRARLHAASRPKTVSLRAGKEGVWKVSVPPGTAHLLTLPA